MKMKPLLPKVKDMEYTKIIEHIRDNINKGLNARRYEKRKL